MLASRFKSDRGSAVVDFILVAAPAALVVLSVVALLITGFGRSLLLDAAIEGARFAAMADQDSDSGCVRAIRQLRQTFGLGWATTAECNQLQINGLVTEVVEVGLSTPMLGLLPASVTLTERAHAQRELQE